ncbi:MAG TPA: protein-disulfide reductase DsbD domain-containing protein, partial [Micavibrio sp.]
MLKFLKFLILPLLYISVHTHAAAAQNHAQISLIPETTHIAAGQTIKIGIAQTLEPGWHSYWLNPGDSGTPLEIEWVLPPGLKAGALAWPTPHKIPFGPLTNYGYENQVTLLQDLTAP